MKNVPFTPTALMMAAIFAAATGLTALPAHAEDTTVAEAVQTLSDAVTASTATETITSDADEAAVDAASGLPKFNSREERRAYFEKMRQENPEKFQEMKRKRQEQWLAQHPQAAAKIQERREWAKAHPEEAQKMREKFQQKLQAIKEKRQENKEARREFKENHPDFPGRRDYKENRMDRREDVRDRREDRWDAKHDGGKQDRIEDRMDRREDMRDRREDRWDAKHGPDRGRPGNGYGRPKVQRGPAQTN